MDIHSFALYTLLISAACLIASIIYFYFWRREILLDYFRAHIVLIGLGVFIFVAASSLSLDIVARKPSDFKAWIISWSSSSGIVLPLVLALITIVGFSVTIHHIYNEQIRISNYDKLLDRSKILLRNAIKRKHKRLQILCNSPLLGSMSGHKTKNYREFKREIEEAAKGCFEKIVCLDWGTYQGIIEHEHVFGTKEEIPDEMLEDIKVNGGEMWCFYETFTQKEQEPWKCARGYLESVQFLRHIASKTVQAKKIDYLPRYHILLDPDAPEAIVSIPLDLPATDPAIATKTPQKVSMLGQLCRDSTTVNLLIRLIANVEKSVKLKNQEGNTAG